MRVSVETAGDCLPRLVEAAARGEDVVLAAGGVAVARIVPIVGPTFRIGILAEDALGPGPDLLDPLPEGELALWEGDG